MTAREILLAAKDAKGEIDRLSRRRQKYLEIATGISGMSESGIRSTTKKSRVEEAALRLVALSDELGDALGRYAGAVAKAEILIRQIKKPRYRQVLELRYLSGHSWRTVADEMDYSDIKSAFRVHGWALMEAEKILENVGRLPP